MDTVIVHVIGAFVAGGAEKFVTDLSVEMAKNFKVVVLALSNRDDVSGKQMKKKLEDGNVVYECGPVDKLGLKTVLWFSKLIEDVKPSIVNLHTPNTELAFYLMSLFKRRRTYKLLRTIHNTNVTKSRFTKWAFQQNRPSTSIACSLAAYKAYKNIIRGELVVIRNGILFDWPIKSNEITNKCREELGLQVDKNHFVCVGSMSGQSVEEMQKAQDIVINAWKRANMAERSSFLHMIGDGCCRTELESLANGDVSVMFHGIQSNVSKWLLASDYYIMASRFEGLPIAAIEAIGTGIPCFFSKIPPLEELNAPAVSWIKIDDTVALSDLFVRSVLGVQESIKCDEIEDFRRRFSIKSTAISYMRLYSS